MEISQNRNMKGMSFTAKVENFGSSLRMMALCVKVGLYMNIQER